MSTLLELLKDGRFHSGQALGQALGVSRSAIWKQLQLLEAELGLVIHKVRGRGYQLATPITLLSSAEIGRSSISSGSWDIRILDSTDSTNAQALRSIEEGSVAPFLVLAERQTVGRGRRGRKWVSPFAENIYYSLVLRMDGGLRQLEGLSLVVGLAVMHTLREYGIPGAGLKWPNDVLVGQKKVAGILLELVGDPADVCHVVLGIGINVNMQSAEEIDQEWTSVRLESGKVIDRNQLVARLNEVLVSYLERHRLNGFSAIQGEWEQGHLWQGRAVSLIAGVNKIDGVVLGIDRQGALRLSVEGEEKTYSGGELSLRLRDGS
ncbi:bifunctional biotin--[acetyl-CoA-carboxylase] synthetase/biotin operon repressor [Pseudomonas protegens]|jgi:BirA family biotin operon repressor/biotin-[acetyl-CoA-carboxylase] ligase|uniref:Bifunctional ligase/repressor BirA n=2 Tax=Pseudomonas protegens TaxID=380021 RepID=Q4K518_PSEF5|nr:bifunctional biotin--[acetyl-CoA-carboxylase] ligase/biotin operon repressor BirA [Pseudomonas protegens]AAY90851.1 bifunctional protein BirA [Pseudomonas protegens Pf-5]ASE21047.1 bifunctional biotin--[acetyl-CoA-carboxylase] synthetase/biotin operon repressor [Pseudomonas protegens]PNV94697.1 bifunctional biotin--[acetyl-CoA-carboxylase] synthetase/biotin operon repressor [Pseudomonas protegens]QEZ49392.1 bifunctional biotin--[acetyl-CoA-carboxylase] synthetase/biotin operon repressor [Pse